LGVQRVWRALRELGFEVSVNTLRHWLYHGKKPRFKPTPLERSLFYHKAYEMALEAKRRHPDWGYKRIATYVSRRLPIRVPQTTVLCWLRGLSKPNATPVRPCPALGYLVGVLVGDYRRSRVSKGLRVKDREFAEHYARMYEEATGVRPEVRPDGSGFYCTYENAAWLKELWRGLWKVVALAYPTEFLRGLYDSEGCVSPEIDRKHTTLKSAEVTLTVGDEEVKELAKTLLTKLGLEPVEEYEPPGVRVVRGREYEFNECWVLYLYGWNKLELFARLIGFREGKRKRRLELLLRIRHLPPRERYKIWTKHYEKRNGRWVERGPKPRRALI